MGEIKNSSLVAEIKALEKLSQYERDLYNDFSYFVIVRNRVRKPMPKVLLCLMDEETTKYWWIEECHIYGQSFFGDFFRKNSFLYIDKTEALRALGAIPQEYYNTALNYFPCVNDFYSLDFRRQDVLVRYYLLEHKIIPLYAKFHNLK